jgi:hypothetical protein
MTAIAEKPLTSVSIRPVETKKELDAFVAFAWEVYKDDANWVPPLRSEVKETLSDVNPFWLEASRKLFVAEKGGRIVGRIAAIENRAHNKFHGDKVGFCGFFECFDDAEAARALFDAAAEWLRSKGLDTMRGPVSPTMDQECGVVVEGLGIPAVIMTAYNPPYYSRLFDACGFAKAKDLLAWYIGTDSPSTERQRLLKIIDRVKTRNNLKVRCLDKKRFEQELQLIQEIYNDAWDKNWGFVPMSAAEVAYTAKKLKPVLEPRAVHFVERDGETLAMGVTLPDVNQALMRLRSGKLTPLNIIRLLWGLRKVNNSRMFALGIRKAHRKTGLDALLCVEAFNAAKELGWKGGEMSWTLEDNDAINNAIKGVGGKVYKVFRMYEKAA